MRTGLPDQGGAAAPSTAVAAAELYRAIEVADAGRCARLLDGGGPALAITPHRGLVPLQHAAACGNLLAARTLLAHGALPTAAGPLTPVGLAAQGGHVPLLTFLVEEAGAPPDDLRRAAQAPELTIPRGTRRLVQELYRRAPDLLTLRRARAQCGRAFMHELACMEGLTAAPGERVRTAMRLDDAALLGHHLAAYAGEGRQDAMNEELRHTFDRTWRHASTACIAVVLQHRPRADVVERMLQRIRDPVGRLLACRYRDQHAATRLLERQHREARRRARAARTPPPATMLGMAAACAQRARHLGWPCPRLGAAPATLAHDSVPLPGEDVRLAESVQNAGAWRELRRQIDAYAALPAPVPPGAWPIGEHTAADARGGRDGPDGDDEAPAGAAERTPAAHAPG